MSPLPLYIRNSWYIKARRVKFTLLVFICEKFLVYKGKEGIFYPPCFLKVCIGNQNRYFLKGISIKIDTFLIPAAPGQPGQPKPLLFKRNFNKNRYFSQSRPLPASLGNQNRYFLIGFYLKIDTFLLSGRSRPAWAIRIVAFSQDFN